MSKPRMKFFDNVAKLIHLLDLNEQKRLLVLCFSAIAMSALEALGVASVFPFMSVVSNPSIVSENVYFIALSEIFHIQNTNVFLVWLGLTLACTFITISFRILHNYLMVKFAQDFLSNFSYRVLERLMKENYRWHLSRSAAGTSQTILSEVDQITSYGVIPLIKPNKFVSGLFWDVFAFNTTRSAYRNLSINHQYCFLWFHSSVSKKFAYEAGKRRHSFNLDRHAVVQNFTTGLKTIKIYQLENSLTQSFRAAASGIASSVTSMAFVKQLPRNILEMCAISLTIISIIVLIWRQGFENVADCTFFRLCTCWLQNNPCYPDCFFKLRNVAIC